MKQVEIYASTTVIIMMKHIRVFFIVLIFTCPSYAQSVPKLNKRYYLVDLQFVGNPRMIMKLPGKKIGVLVVSYCQVQPETQLNQAGQAQK